VKCLGSHIFQATGSDGGEVVSLRVGRALHEGKFFGTHVCQRLSQPQYHSAARRLSYTTTDVFPTLVAPPSRPQVATHVSAANVAPLTDGHQQ
jgi:hypothetical protein